jgi:hypothetical protein
MAAMTTNQKLLLAAAGVGVVGAVIIVSKGASAAPSPSGGLPPGPGGPAPLPPSGQTGPGTFSEPAGGLSVSKKGNVILQTSDPSFVPIPQALIPQIAPGTPNYLGDPSTLQQGQRYRAKLELTGFQSLASAPMIAQQFQTLGFSNPIVYMDSSQLPADWPALTAVGATANSRFVEATWSQPTNTIPRPPQIQLAWPA